jgi:predicted MFS family arabinose efflux permease
MMIMAAPEKQRRTALSLDSVSTEFSYMAGPALGVWAATKWDTAWSIFVFEWLSIAAGIVLAALNPALRTAAAEDEQGDGETPPRRSWFGLQVLAVLAAAAATTVVLGGSDVSIVAALRSMDAQPHLGWVLALWGAGSIVGGLVYGAWHQAISVFWLLAGLALVTAPVALATNLPVAAVLIFVSGLFCAPTITATVDHLSRLVPERARGEAIGWHGSSMTTGMAFGAPMAGFAIDAGGWQAGFLVVSAVGLLIAVVGASVMRLRAGRDRRGEREFQPAAAR